MPDRYFAGRIRPDIVEFRCIGHGRGAYDALTALSLSLPPTTLPTMSDTTPSKPILFLLEREFHDPAIEGGQRFFCRHSLLLEGVLASQPALRDQLDVRHVAFPRPRQAVIGAVGDADQSLPKLVLPSAVRSEHASGEYASRQYVSGSDRILATLGELYGIAQPHP